MALVALAMAACGGPPPERVHEREGPVRIGVHVRELTPEQADRIVRGGARLIRTTLQWGDVERRQGQGYDWRTYDRLITTTASRRLGYLPVLIGSPAWAAPASAQPPRPEAMPAFLHFIRQAVARYGPGGGFWRQHPGLPRKPIRAWQVWNEPNLPAFWANPDPRAYAKLLEAVGSTIRDVDRRATIVLAGMPRSVVSYPIDQYLADLYELPGFSDLFDVAAVHAYAGDTAGVTSVVDATRALMDKAGDGDKPIWITEFGWASAGPVRDTMRVKTPIEQAKLLRGSIEAIRRAAAESGVRVVVWYDLQDYTRPSAEPDRFTWHTGLFGPNGEPKPAWDAFADVAGGRPGRGALPGK
jgi:hypothetical protein